MVEQTQLLYSREQFASTLVDVCSTVFTTAQDLRAMMRSMRGTSSHEDWNPQSVDTRRRVAITRLFQSEEAVGTP